MEMKQYKPNSIKSAFFLIAAEYECPRMWQFYIAVEALMNLRVKKYSSGVQGHAPPKKNFDS